MSYIQVGKIIVNHIMLYTLIHSYFICVSVEKHDGAKRRQEGGSACVSKQSKCEFWRSPCDVRDGVVLGQAQDSGFFLTNKSPILCLNAVKPIGTLSIFNFLFCCPL